MIDLIDSPKSPEEMVDEQIVARGIYNTNVIDAMKKVPRALFVPEEYRYLAYSDQPLPIGYGQTISQPYVVAFMTQSLELNSESKVLEIGTGSGYQTTILAEIAKEVYSVEIIKELQKRAMKILDDLGYKNIKFKTGNGREGWKEYAPYDRIIVTAASNEIPEPLIEQLADNGIMIIPVGPRFCSQDLIKIKKTSKGLLKETLLPVRFVPLVKKHKKKEE
ncbi:MAG: protein-L-isoaspartate(D-aspartate) O-methyltransferase [Candidatus Marinimicrobia bacterium]|nr:protein-L-isoaspartate(D-aspartate) O-methyltransferase [Candidatus Neomarinimicrobiota bacterium]